MMIVSKNMEYLFSQIDLDARLDEMLGLRPARSARPTSSERLLSQTIGDHVAHVETKGRRKGTRRERKTGR